MGDATESDTATTSTHFAKTTAAYDIDGRTTSSTDYISASDTTGRTTSTAYTPADGGLLTKTVVTNPLAQTTTTSFDPGRGSTLETIDVAGHKTDATYDSLGRVTAVWKPGEPEGYS
ncbi:MAG TPA: hypothetical protein VK816_08650, partial [Jatrophihabitantaceae bacterium]|nr:hypothetical protein [Jatrophihabitantaceae bacterium]